VKYFSWSPEKNRLLQETRGISFEEVVFHVERGDVLDILKHPNQEKYSGQRIMVVNVEGYAYLFEDGEWKSVSDKNREVGRLQDYATATFKKDRRINIRISSKDLNSLQKRALEEGIPYQTLVSSILHKYVSGRLRERSA